MPFYQCLFNAYIYFLQACILNIISYITVVISISVCHTKGFKDSNPNISVLSKSLQKQTCWPLFFQILSSIVDPLLQMCSVSASRLNTVDMATYMINCMYLIQNTLALYEFTDQRLEMLQAQVIWVDAESKIQYRQSVLSKRLSIVCS